MGVREGIGLTDDEKLDRVAAANKRFDTMIFRKRQQLRKSEAFEPIDWQKSKAEFDEEPTERAGQKHLVKQKVDVIEKLMQAGSLKEDHRIAVNEIRRMYEAIGKGLFPCARALENEPVDGRAAYRDPIDRMKEVEVIIYTNRYKPWADAMSRIPVKDDPKVTLLTLSIDMIVDNMGPYQWEHMNRLPRRTATNKLAMALESYLEG